jgi:hypothetical protein
MSPGMNTAGSLATGAKLPAADAWRFDQDPLRRGKQRSFLTASGSSTFPRGCFESDPCVAPSGQL